MDLQVGINISPLQIENSDFVNRIRQKIHDEDIKPEWIDIEITEGVAMSSQVSMEEIFSGFSKHRNKYINRQFWYWILISELYQEI
jgi:hypothetical protein